MTESTYSREAQVSKIQKLLNLAGDPNANEHVAAQAAAKAQSLMQQWAIDEAALDAASGKQSDPFISVEVPWFKGKMQPWEVQLRLCVAKAMMVYAFRNASKGCVTFAGRSADVEVAVYMFVQLRNLLAQLSRARLSEHGADMKRRFNKSIYNVTQCRALSGCHPTVYRQRWLDSWLDGAWKGVSAKLEAQAAVTNATSSTALAVVETRREEAANWARVEFGIVSVKKARARQQFEGAQAKGYQDGLNVQIHKGITANEPKKLT